MSQVFHTSQINFSMYFAEKTYEHILIQLAEEELHNSAV